MAEPAGVETGMGAPILALCGESVLIKGLEVSLRSRAGVQTVLVDTARPDAFQVLGKLSPHIIVFELTPSQLICILPFLRTHHDVVLIGLDVARDQALFLAVEWCAPRTVADLMQVIETRIHVKNGR
jgi:hypothetical protein